MTQKTILSLLALPTGPARTFSPKTPASIPALYATLLITSVFSGGLLAVPVYSCSLSISPVFTAELRVTNVST